MIGLPMAMLSTSSNCMSGPITGRPSMLQILPFPLASHCWHSRLSEMKVHAGPDDRGLRLDVFLAQRLKDLTRSQIQILNRSGSIRVDGRQDKAGYRVRGGETIEVALDTLKSAPLTPEQIPL